LPGILQTLAVLGIGVVAGAGAGTAVGMPEDGLISLRMATRLFVWEMMKVQDI